MYREQDATRLTLANSFKKYFTVELVNSLVFRFNYISKGELVITKIQIVLHNPVIFIVQLSMLMYFMFY